MRFHAEARRDAYDAIVTDRPYRKSLGEEEARRRLVEASGAQFDPQVVDALARVLEKKGAFAEAPPARAVPLAS